VRSDASIQKEGEEYTKSHRFVIKFNLTIDRGVVLRRIFVWTSAIE